jgi:hypothetical protein
LLLTLIVRNKTIHCRFYGGNFRYSYVEGSYMRNNASYGALGSYERLVQSATRRYIKQESVYSGDYCHIDDSDLKLGITD